MRALLFVGLFFAAGCAGNAIIGRVVDEHGAPVARAEVATEPATDPVLTNAQGAFAIRQRIDAEGRLVSIPAGAYRIRVTKPEFETLELSTEVDGTVHLGSRTMVAKRLDIEPTAPTVSDDPPIDHTRPDIPVDGQ